jgi:integration host factor subunit alpha
LKLNPERDVAPPERLEEFDGAVDYSYGTTNTNASFDQLREHGRSHQSTMHSQTGAVIDMSSSSLTKAELANLLFEQVGLNKREAKELVDAFFDELYSALERGESVKLTGFGNFQLRDKVPRPGRNPKTGVEVQIPARRVVTFHPSQKLKDMVDDDSTTSKSVDGSRFSRTSNS